MLQVKLDSNAFQEIMEIFAKDYSRRFSSFLAILQTNTLKTKYQLAYDILFKAKLFQGHGTI
jgi:hypothetical protein